MARKNYGKDFEEHFKSDFIKTFPKEFILRLKDNTSRYKSSSKNPCDFLAHVKDKIFMVETKCHYKNTFPFSDLKQYDELVEYKNLKNTIRVVIIWFIDHDLVIGVPIPEITKMMKDGLKSVHYQTCRKYNIVEFNSTKKRVFLDVDYSKLLEVEDEENE